MKKLLRVAILAALLLLSLVFYNAGFETGGITFFIIGLVVEMAFWFGVFGSNDIKQNNAATR